MMNAKSTTLTLLVSLALAAGSSAAPLEVKSLAPADSLRKVAERIGTNLSDGVISTGMLSIRSMVLTPTPNRAPTAAALTELNVRLAKKIALEGYFDALPAGLKLETTVAPISGTLVIDTAKIIAEEVNAFDPNSHQHEGINRMLWVVLSKLGGHDAKISVVTSRGIINDDPEDVLHLTQTLFVNTQTGKIVLVHMIEGRM